MGFRDELQHLVEDVDGAVAASVMGMDGIAIDTVEAADDRVPEVDIQTLLVEYNSILGQLMQAGEVLETGHLDELTVATERLITLTRRMSDEYYAVLAIVPSALLGRARYRLRLTASRLCAEL